jgi:O-acetyl-ADP-ribose deacetylase (regulator of RNase III)
MKVLKGNLIQLALQGEFDVIVHGCNCFCTMASGIAKQIAQTFPEARDVDARTGRGIADKLGSISYAQCDPVLVVNGYTQYSYGRDPKVVYVDYDAVRSVFQAVKTKFAGERIGYPMLGAGLANGDWEVIAEIINEELDGENHTLVELA